MSFKKKLLSMVLVSAISIGGYEYVKNEFFNKDIEKIIDNLGSDESNIDIIVDSLKSSFNDCGKYEVLSGEVSLDHIYKYKEGKVTMTVPIINKKITLLDPEIIKSCTATAMFDFDIESLSNSDVQKVDENTVKILIDYPTLDKESVKRKEGSLVIDTENTKTNFDAKMAMMGQSVYSKLKETMDARATRGMEDDFDKESPNKIMEIYNSDEEKIKELEESAIASVNSLTNGFLKNIIESTDISTDSLNFVVELKESKLPKTESNSTTGNTTDTKNTDVKNEGI